MSSKPMKRMYLSGAISNNPHYKEDFAAAEKALTEAGFLVANPVSFCREGWSWQRCMRQCIQVLSTHTRMALVDSDIPSRGMALELKIAAALGIEVSLVSTWLEKAKEEALSDAF